MLDHEFVFDFVPDTYVDRVQRAAVLYPLVKVCRSTFEMQQAAAHLLTMWRARLWNLQQHHWLIIQDEHKLSFARNCLPAFAFATPRTRPCGLRDVCPFCYARSVRGIWNTVEQALHGPHVEFGHHVLVERQLRYAAPYRSPGVKLANYEAESQRLGGLLAHIARDRGRAIRNYKALGGFYQTSVEPGRSSWRMRTRQLLLYPAGVKPPLSLLVEDKQRTVRVHTQPTRSVLLGAVARTCRYPRRLLLGDPARTAQFLDLKRYHRIRLSAAFGVFRGASND